MALSRALNTLICRALIGVFLFAQLAVSAYACPGQGQMVMAAVMDQTAAPVDMSDDMQSGCEQMDSQAPNLCAEHCKVGQQNSDTTPAPMVAPPVLALLYEVTALTQVRHASPRPPDRVACAAAPPPHAILHCVFRI